MLLVALAGCGKGSPLGAEVDAAAADTAAAATDAPSDTTTDAPPDTTTDAADAATTDTVPDTTTDVVALDSSAYDAAVAEVSDAVADTFMADAAGKCSLTEYDAGPDVAYDGGDACRPTIPGPGRCNDRVSYPCGLPLVPAGTALPCDECKVLCAPLRAAPLWLPYYPCTARTYPEAGLYTVVTCGSCPL